ncbi:MAG: hypothetical protein PUJ72_01680 [Eubacteriales bacterium]|nr:hypothetical protein [Eubacteriales bacterium]
MDIYEIKSFDAENFLNFYEQVCDQIWYVFNADRIKKTPVEEQDEEENKRLREVEDKFLIHSEDADSNRLFDKFGRLHIEPPTWVFLSA